jgi:hypothetical protein
LRKETCVSFPAEAVELESADDCINSAHVEMGNKGFSVLNTSNPSSY